MWPVCSAVQMIPSQRIVGQIIFCGDLAIFNLWSVVFVGYSTRIHAPTFKASINTTPRVMAHMEAHNVGWPECMA
jgi:hypothetical protein